MRRLIRKLCWTTITKPILYMVYTTDREKLAQIKVLYLQCPVIPLNKEEWDLNRTLASRVTEILWDI